MLELELVVVDKPLELDCDLVELEADELVVEEVCDFELEAEVVDVDSELAVVVGVVVDEADVVEPDED